MSERRERIKAEYRRVILRVMVEMMIVDGFMADEELQTIIYIYGRISGEQIEVDEVKQVAQEVGQPGVDAWEEVRKLASDITLQGKSQVLRAAFAVANSDRTIEGRENELLYPIGEALGLSAEEVDQIAAREAERMRRTGRP